MRRSALPFVLLLLAACDSATEPPGEEPGGETPITPVAVPSQGNAATLDVATWNVEWFGHAGNGPTDERLQRQRVRDVIAGADLELWALQEVVTRAAFDSLLAGLAGYEGVLANEPRVAQGATWYSDFDDEEQKVALLWKSSALSFRSARVILGEQEAAFAGRPPLEVRFDVTLGDATEELVVIVLHNKAGADTASLRRRGEASLALEAYLDATWPAQQVLVLGDWNDDVDGSIVAGRPTPFANFLADTLAYRFPTAALTEAGLSSTVSYADLIDHHLVTNELFAAYVPGSAAVFRADQHVPDYATVASDHYPVITRYAAGAP